MKYYPDSNIYRYEHGNLLGRFGGFNILNILNKDFEIIQEQDEIDIQSIKELNKEIAYINIDIATAWTPSEKIIIEQQNKIIRAIKQLDKKIKEK